MKQLSTWAKCAVYATSQNKTNYKTSGTIIKVTDNKIELLREGDIKFEEIKERLGTGIIYE